MQIGWYMLIGFSILLSGSFTSIDKEIKLLVKLSYFAITLRDFLFVFSFEYVTSKRFFFFPIIFSRGFCEYIIVCEYHLN